MRRLLITGAAGGIGKVMRSRLAHLAETIRVADIAEMDPAGPGEEVVRADLADRAAVDEMVAGCDAILHLGGVSKEDEFAKILPSNIVGVYHLYEAARAHGRPRILFASSNHAVGYHRQDAHLSADCTLRPDGLYGVSKCYGEAMASFYHDKFGQETAIVRIGSCREAPADHRMLATWMSFDDFAALAERAFTAPMLGCPVIWGMSDNEEVWWDNSASRYLGWRPRDTSAVFRERLDAENPRPAPDEAVAVFQGGVFTEFPVFGEE